MTRPTWDAYFLDIAATVATRSPCVKRKVGAVLVSQDRAILATGYNGPPRGAPHRDETTCVRIGIPSGERADVVCCAHAEINAIAQAARHGVPVKGATLYVTTSPCAWCARSIVNAGVVCVVRSGDYNDPVATTVFAESNVPVRGPGNDPPFTGEQIKQSFARADRLRDERDGHVFEKGVEVAQDDLLALLTEINRLAHAGVEDDSQPAFEALRLIETLTAAPAASPQAKATANRIRNLEGIRELSFQQIQALEAEVARLNAICAGWERDALINAQNVADTEKRIAAAITDPDAEMATAASDTVDPAYWRGNDAGVIGTVQAIVRIIDGPLTAEPSFGSPELNALAKRIIAMRTELDAVHADLGALTQERDEASGRLNEIIEAVGNLAHKAGIAWADADLATALDVIAAAKAIASERNALILWVDGKGSLGDGPIAKAVLRYAKEHEDRVWEAAEQKHAEALERALAEFDTNRQASASEHYARVQTLVGVLVAIHGAALAAVASPGKRQKALTDIAKMADAEIQGKP